MPMEPGQGTAGATGTLTVGQVSQQLGISTELVNQFCKDKGFTEHDGHYDIPASYLDQIRQWASGRGR